MILVNKEFINTPSALFGQGAISPQGSPKRDQIDPRELLFIGEGKREGETPTRGAAEVSVGVVNVFARVRGWMAKLECVVVGPYFVST